MNLIITITRKLLKTLEVHEVRAELVQMGLTSEQAIRAIAYSI